MSLDSECREVSNGTATSHFTTIQLMEAGTDTPAATNNGSGNRSDLASSSSSTNNQAATTTTTSPSNLEEGRASLTAAADYLYFDANTFKQVKRLYEGMLMVAIAYSVTMVLMMIVLYKTLPQAMLEQQQQQQHHMQGSSLPAAAAAAGSSMPHAGTSFKHSLLRLEGKGQADGEHRSMKTTYKTGNDNYHSSFGTFNHPETAMNYLDQMIAINFLSLILYSLAFYAAHREMRTLTLAFTSTLGFTMMFSVVKLFVEGVHFPNNFMSLLLRISIVFVALVYLGQLRRKQQSRMSPNQTAQLIREFLASAGNGRDSDKTDEDIIREYQDQPPNYEEALRCPVPGGRLSARVVAHDGKSLRSTSSQITLSAPPPPFEQIASLDCATACGSGEQQQQHHQQPKQSHLRPLSVQSFEVNGGGGGDAHSTLTAVEVADDTSAGGLARSNYHHPLSQSLTSINSSTIITVDDGGGEQQQQQQQQREVATIITASNNNNNNNIDDDNSNKTQVDSKKSSKHKSEL